MLQHKLTIDVPETSQFQKEALHEPLKENPVKPPPPEFHSIEMLEPQIYPKTILATIILAGGVATSLALYFINIVSIGVLLGICGGAYVIYLILVCTNTSLISSFQEIRGEQSYETFCSHLKNQVGFFEFHVQCYHDIKLTHQQRAGPRYHKRPVYKTHTQKFISHTNTYKHAPLSARDQSGEIEKLKVNTKFMFIKTTLHHKFQDERSESIFQKIYSEFKRRNNFDINKDFTEIYTMERINEEKTFYIGEMTCNISLWFYVFTALGCSWPFTSWLQSKITRVNLNLMKILTF